jgi:hypothetical protein
MEGDHAMTDKEALIELASGVAFGFAVIGVLVLFSAFFGSGESKSKEKYEVVDHYGTCAVVRYRPENRAQDVYFLDCREVR